VREAGEGANRMLGGIPCIK